MASFLLPALILVAAACISDPRQCGSLVVIIPQVGIVLFLALVLGRYIVFEPALLIAAAESSRHVVRQRLRTLRLRSQKPTAAVFGVHVGASVLIGVIGALLFGAELGDMAAAALISGSLALGLATVVTVLATGLLSATGRSDRITGWITLVFFVIGFFVVTLLAAGELHVEGRAAVAAPVVVVGFSEALPIARLRRLPTGVCKAFREGAPRGLWRGPTWVMSTRSSTRDLRLSTGRCMTIRFLSARPSARFADCGRGYCVRPRRAAARVRGPPTSDPRFRALSFVVGSVAVRPALVGFAPLRAELTGTDPALQGLPLRAHGECGLQAARTHASGTSRLGADRGPAPALSILRGAQPSAFRICTAVVS